MVSQYHWDDMGHVQPIAMSAYNALKTVRSLKPPSAWAGLAVPERCRDLEISSATFYKWRSKYGGMDVSLMAPHEELEAEIVTEALGKVVRPSRRRKMAQRAVQDRGVSIRRWPARRSGSARLAIGTSPRRMPRTRRSPTGCIADRLGGDRLARDRWQVIRRPRRAVSTRPARRAPVAFVVDVGRPAAHV